MSPRQTSGRRPQSTRTGQAPTSGQTGPRAEPLKFEGEFDFEQANARFEQEIEKEFSDKLKISSGGSGKHHSKESKHERDLDSSLTHSPSMTLQDMQDQQHMLMKQKSLSTGLDHTSESKDQHHHHVPNSNSMEDKNFYDKNISFFDRISCESNDKMQTKERKNWKEERKMNTETFGLMQRQQSDMKSNYPRTYNNNNRYNNNNNNRDNNNSGRNYPRNYNSNGQQQTQQYRSNNNNNLRQSQQQQQQRMPVGNSMGQRSNYNNNNNNNNNMNYRRNNDLEVSYSNGQRGGQRRFGSR